MKLPPSSLLVLCLGLGVWSGSLAAQAPCRAADAESTKLRSYIRELVATTDPQRVLLRNDLGLVTMDSLQVTLVTDATICTKAVAGMNLALSTPGLARSVHVVKIKNDWGVRDPGNPSGEHVPTMILDKKFKYKSSVLAP